MKIMNRMTVLCSLWLAGSSAMAETIKIDLWEQDSPEAAKEMDKWISVFAKRNPNIKVVRQHYENEELRAKFLRSSVTGDGADLVYGPNDLAGVFKTASVIQPVDEWLKKDQFNPTALGVMSLEGKTWGVPVSEGNHLMLFYNKAMVSQAPDSFDALIKEGKKHTNPKENKYGLAMFQSEPFWFMPILGGHGGWPLSESGNKTNVTINNDKTKAALQFLVDLKNKHQILPKDCDYDCAKSMFLAGKAPYHINGDWEVKTLREKLGKNLGIAPIPKIASTGKWSTPLLGGRFVFINKAATGKRLEAAKAFIKFITEEQVQLRMATKLDRIPATIKVRSSKKVQSLDSLQPLIDAAAHAKPSPSQVEMRAAWDGMRIMVQRALSGKETVAQAVATGQKAADEALGAIREKGEKSH
ncbi:extracellular solute-binding protein [Pseudobacteriovorax antillogorgiicola]|uniref:Arabinogalactan oligomer / maltooligosaccharide transport system substrate-binding protein n=1 Tax=Pseudobacteriovorax antillogorgiicola TaxID=1513793 RepID=A0A1Y6BGR3_9BACT|nr:extracellular solute-binding protein [Pseudobacteriovorax antillogorgiicola]TCS55572.1 arabinogalactan oligomer/maltooligosaccharide transport system substrate-binding protein [Pseudobacteriovorax antillogorgiicola]SMF10707.1 arabinogalactan oligomer / maltooligosaccharide transport system substrate-binding protein [Pseudobacteriovorax antillogorgiicola]